MPEDKPKKPLIELTQSQMKELDDLKETAERAQEAIDALKLLGMDTSELQGMVDKAKLTQETLIKNFAPGKK